MASHITTEAGSIVADPSPRIIYEKSSIDDSGVIVQERYQDSSTAVEKGEDLITRIINPRSMLEIIDEATNFRIRLHEALASLDKEGSDLNPEQATEEIFAQLPSLTKEQRAEMAGYNPMEILEKDDRKLHQARIMLDWTPDFLKRWKLLVDGIESQGISDN